MLITISDPNLDLQFIESIIQDIAPDDLIIFWQEGIFHLLKNENLLNHGNILVLERDVKAFGIDTSCKQISLTELVKITELHHNHLAL